MRDDLELSESSAAAQVLEGAAAESQLHQRGAELRKIAGLSLVRRMLVSVPLLSLIMAHRARCYPDERIDEHQRDTDDDPESAMFEGWPMPLADVEIGKVEHRSPTGTSITLPIARP